jgi:hypothetical protein
MTILCCSYKLRKANPCMRGCVRRYTSICTVNVVA